MKYLLVIAAVAVFAIGTGGSAFAFHSGGVAECGGCHSMHAPKTGGAFLMVGTDQSSTCLSCHEGPTLSSYHVSTTPANQGPGVPPVNRTPGGDFGWVKKTYSFVQRSSTVTEAGQSHGHNIIAVDNGYSVDPDKATAPGGTFPSSQLACNSCHDPHGKYRRLSDGTVATAGAPIIGSGSYDTSTEPAANQAVGAYRLLAGEGYSKAPFAGVPAAKAPSTYNRSEALTQTRVAYGNAATAGHTAWGTWCGTCHGDMHSSGNYVHPVDATLGDLATTYGQYVKSGDMGGSAASSFTSLVPFVEGTGDYTVLASHAKNNNSVLSGPASSDRVSCISCHRAHATGFPEMLRWNMEGEFMVKNAVYGGTDSTPSDLGYARGKTQAETMAAYYERPVTVFASYQRVLCNKCHAKD